MNSLLKWTGIGCGGMLGLVVLLLGVGLLLPEPPKPTPPPSPTESPSAVPAPTASAASDSMIGKTDEFGTVVTVDTPKRPACQRKFSEVDKAVFEECLIADLTYVQVVNVIGFRGDLVMAAGNLKTYQWKGRNASSITASFVDGKLKSKTQIGLE